MYLKRRKERLDRGGYGIYGYERFQEISAQKLSGGLLRRLNIACGIAHKPELIFMDEPTVAVDPQSRNSILEGIKMLNRNGATIHLYHPLYGRGGTDLFPHHDHG